MNYRSFQTWVVTIFQVELGATALVLLLASCGGGHNPGDTYPASPPASPAAVTGPDSFLLFPNPQSSPAINSPTYAQAYYYAIDPNNDKDTLAKWKAANHFGDLATGSEVQAVFGDVRDLGYGRYMYGRKNADGTLAFIVENYLVWTTANYAYSSLNLDAAVAKDPRWHVNTNAIEFSPGPNGGAPFAKYYSFDTTGARLLAANLDGRGNKSMPGICINCHGGRGDALLPATASAVMGQFPVFGNPASGVRGDVKGKLHFFEPDSFAFSTLTGNTRADYEAAIKTLNQWVLCTYPLPSSASGVPVAFVEDACRPVAATNEWQGGSADIVKAAYNNGHLPVAGSGVIDGMPNATYSDTYVPDAWVTSGQTTLYNNVVKPTCRGCHLLRGVGPQSNIDFSTFAGFQAYADRIKHHLLDRGNMPLSKILYERFWSTSSMYQTLDSFLQASNPVAGSAVSYTVLDASNNPLRPGRPIASAGPDRVVGTVSTTLSAAGSLYADTFIWSIVTDPIGTATMNNTSGVQTTFNAPTDGTYVVQLVASKGSVQSDPVLLKIVVNSTAWPATISPVSGSLAINNPLPAAIHFADIKNVMQQNNLSTGKASACTQCHTTQPLLNALLIPPVLYTDIDRNGDGVVDVVLNGADDLAFYSEVRGRINFSDIEASALLRHPAGYNHSGGVRDGFGIASSSVGGVGTSADQFTPGDPVRSAYDMFLNWILNGAPY